MDINEKINQANLRLKAAQVGVSIVRLGNRLYLQATLPPKPDSHRTKRHQQRIALHFYANPAGVQQAEKEARKVGALIACREFDWAPYLKESEPEPERVQEWVVLLFLGLCALRWHGAQSGMRFSGRLFSGLKSEWWTVKVC